MAALGWGWGSCLCGHQWARGPAPCGGRCPPWHKVLGNLSFGTRHWWEPFAPVGLGSQEGVLPMRNGPKHPLSPLNGCSGAGASRGACVCLLTLPCTSSHAMPWLSWEERCPLGGFLGKRCPGTLCQSSVSLSRDLFRDGRSSCVAKTSRERYCGEPLHLCRQRADVWRGRPLGEESCPR